LPFLSANLCPSCMASWLFVVNLSIMKNLLVKDEG
jgi:hypothetical protein